MKEASGIFIIFLFYDISRYFALAEVDIALANARKVIQFEKLVGLNVERAFQNVILPYPSFTSFLGTFYLAAHWGSVVLFFVWTVTRIGNDKLKREEYVRVRGRFILMNLLAAIVFLYLTLALPLV